jgi:hypothetical protein
VKALKLSDFKENNITFSKNVIPKEYPAAIVVLDNEQGKNGTAKRFTDWDIDFSVFLIVSIHNITDPDLKIVTVKQDFREQFLQILGSDFSKVEYYNARADAGREVRIAKINLRLK